MCKFYIYSTDRRAVSTDILELSSSQEVKAVFHKIKSTSPRVSLGVYGARDLTTFKRTHRNLGKYKMFRSADEFVEKVTT